MDPNDPIELLWCTSGYIIIISIPDKISSLNLIACSTIFGISVSSGYKWYLSQAFSQWLYQNIDQVTDIMDPGFRAVPNTSNLIFLNGAPFEHPLFFYWGLHLSLKVWGRRKTPGSKYRTLWRHHGLCAKILCKSNHPSSRNCVNFPVSFLAALAAL